MKKTEKKASKIVADKLKNLTGEQLSVAAGGACRTCGLVVSKIDGNI